MVRAYKTYYGSGYPINWVSKLIGDYNGFMYFDTYDFSYTNDKAFFKLSYPIPTNETAKFMSYESNLIASQMQAGALTTSEIFVVFRRNSKSYLHRVDLNLDI